MFKTFNFGIVFGVLATAGLGYFVPAVDQHREPSLISVEANGGNRESFHINLPQDRIVAGMAEGDAAVPPGLAWPEGAVLSGTRTELFKLRDAHDVVVGVASRISGSGGAAGTVVEWTLHLPARGTIYATMQPGADAAGDLRGSLRAGTREFADMTGEVRERLASGGGESSAGVEVEGRIQLSTALVGAAGDDE